MCVCVGGGRGDDDRGGPGPGGGGGCAGGVGSRGASVRVCVRCGVCILEAVSA